MRFKAGFTPRTCRPAVLLVCFLAFASTCLGSAFAISEQGSRAGGMGTAFTSIANDGSALFYNPAGIAFQPGAHMEMDNLVVVGLFRFKPSNPLPGTVVPQNGFSGSVRPHFIPVASLYATYEYSPKITLGFGAFAPFGLADNFTNFHDSDPNLTKFTGRFAGTRAKLESYWFQPTIAYRVTENSAIAVGPAFVHTHLLIEQSILNPRGDALEFGRQAANTIFPGVDQEQAARVIARLLPEGRSRIAGTSNSPAFAVGYLYKHRSSKTNFGLMFRSAVTNHLQGRASFAFGTGYTLEKYIGSDFLFKAFPNQKIRGSFTTPATYAVGISNSALWNTTFSFDFRLQDFRRFSSVPLNFSVNTLNSTSAATPPEKRLIFDFRNSFHVAMGLERPINERTTVRLGYIFDRSPVPDQSVGPLFPDANRNGFTLGGTRKSGAKEYSFFYQALKFQDRITNVAANNNIFTNGNYDSFAHLAGVSLRFDASDMFKKRH